MRIQEAQLSAKAEEARRQKEKSADEEERRRRLEENEECAAMSLEGVREEPITSKVQYIGPSYVLFILD